MAGEGDDDDDNHNDGVRSSEEVEGKTINMTTFLARSSMTNLDGDCVARLQK